LPSDSSSDQSYAQDERRLLALLERAGWRPKVIYDIGAAVGGWTETVRSVCPDAEYHLFEPLADAVPMYRAELAERLARLSGLSLHKVALGRRTGKATVHVADDAWSSSLIDMSRQPNFNRKVSVPVYRLDDYVAEFRLPPPDFVKMDTQATEHHIVAGGKRSIGQAKLLMIETWLSPEYGWRTPLLTQMMARLKRLDFLLCELGGRYYDERHRLYGVDAFFARRDLLAQFAPHMPQGSW
jgi:FkbM family methyltransferase